MNKYLAFLFSALVLTQIIMGQPNIQSQKGDLVKIMVSPSSETFNYEVGEKVTFDIAIYKFGKLIPNANIYYEIGPDKQKPVKTGKIELKRGTGAVQVDGMDRAGFLRCYVSYEENGYKYENTGTAGIAPDQIRPHVKMPNDFKEFWDNNLKDLQKIPVNSVVTLMPEKCTHKVNVYKVRLDNVPVIGSHITHVYGILCIPKDIKNAPAILKVPGAGVRSYNGLVSWAEKGFITFEIGINGIPVDLYDSEIYEDLKYGALWRYVYNNMDNRDNAYMKRVFLSCVRAVDFIFTLDEFDEENCVVTGGSQGGALSIVTASLDKRIKALTAYYPAMCDMVGYLDDVGGWPHMFTGDFVTTNKKIETAAYFDVVNFAKLLDKPGYYSYGYNDNVCPPTSICAALNSIESDKTIVPFFDTSHWKYREEDKAGTKWLFNMLTKPTQ